MQTHLACEVRQYERVVTETDPEERIRQCLLDDTLGGRISHSVVTLTTPPHVSRKSRALVAVMRE